jgi:hypothetical protein
MALDQKALQKKRAKRELKRKQAKKATTGLSGAAAMAHAWTVAAHAPVADVLFSPKLFEVGIGSVWLSRQLPDGRYAFAGIVVDVFCLGVKNAMYNIMEEDAYRAALTRIQATTEEALERQEPACARKLVEGAVAYAKDLGFEPHPDYRIARLIFGDIDTADCATEFTYGREGKPLYTNGPNENAAMQRRIVNQLARRCGPGGYEYYLEVSRRTAVDLSAELTRSD